jgi:hypothetical protein
MDDQNEKDQNGKAVSQGVTTLEPIVIKTKKKKKYKYSRGLRDLQKSGRSVSKVSSRLARSVSKGMDAYRKASDKSARKKRDGAIRDFGLNMAKGVSKTLRESSRTPYDLARAMSQRGSRRLIRRQVRAASRMARLFRLR